ncbi:hypothetical protein [Mycobacterium sp. TY815]|uniref:hypothetical protein n=1 Tax=Mycobacterium sp. TY815 TaxID=3050581 RepID=UPI0027414A03|nr:hypothetical protein [Mycobacterium sp. TY815]MDP7706441.1 hypothetical protein [Mycobacterium sp. TY815]
MRFPTSLGVSMVYIGTDPLVHGPATTSDSGERAVSVPGLVAAATWAVGLVIGLVAMASGHELLAGVALVLAIMSPWLGLAWVARTQRADMRRQRALAQQAVLYPGSWPTLQLTAR